MYEIKSVRTVQLIEVAFKRGSGTEMDPNRIVTQYWDENGDLIAEHDPEHYELLLDAL